MSLFGRKGGVVVAEEPAPKTKAALIAELAALKAQELADLARLDEVERVVMPAFEAAKTAFNEAQMGVYRLSSDRTEVRLTAGRRAGALERSLRDSAPAVLKAAIAEAKGAVQWMHGVKVYGESFEIPESDEGRAALMQAPAKLEKLMMLDLAEDELERRIADIAAGVE